MKTLTLENFRLFENYSKLDLAPISILTGRNNSGKSSILKSLMLLSDYLESDNHLRIRFDGPLRLKHGLTYFKNAKTYGDKKFFSINYDNDYFNVAMKFDGDDNADYGLLKFLELKFSDTNQYLSLERLSEKSIELKFTPAFFYANEQKYAHDYLQEESSISINELEDLIKNINQQIRQEKNDSDESNSGIVKQDYLNKLKKRRGEIRKQISKQKKIYNGEEGTFSAIIPLSDENESRRIGDLIYKGIKDHMSPIDKAGFSYFYLTKIKSKASSDSVVNQATREIENFISYQVYHIGANRYTARNYYENKLDSNDIGELFSSYSNKNIKEGSPQKEFLKYWMKKLNIGEDLKVEDIDGALYFPEIKKDGSWHKLNEFGFGTGQLLPILLRIASIPMSYTSAEGELIFVASKLIPGRKMILIEEPESNTHPALQSLLAELFYDAWKRFKIQFLIETHSEYLIRNFQVLVNQNADASFLKVYYLKEREYYEMIVADDGKFQNEFGQGFFDESARQAFKIL